jgi:hypothetical protein
MLDLRLPIGLMFSLVGVLLAVYGLATGGNAELYQRSLGINVNLWWGLFLAVFGSVVLYFARRDASKNKTP